MITQEQKQQLKAKVAVELTKANMDYQIFDTDAEIDSSLTYAENYSIIMGKIEQLLNSDVTYNLKHKAQRDKQRIEMESMNITEQRKEQWIKKLVHKSVICAVLGARGSGKSALGFHYLELHHALNPVRPCCVYKFPKAYLLP